jgi:hypothetical protein
VSYFVEVNVRDNTDGGLFFSTSGYAPSVYAQIAEIKRRQIELAGETKIVNLCQQFVQERRRTIWIPNDVLPRVLFDEPIGRRLKSDGPDGTNRQ